MSVMWGDNDEFKLPVRTVRYQLETGVSGGVARHWPDVVGGADAAIARAAGDQRRGVSLDLHLQRAGALAHHRLELIEWERRGNDPVDRAYNLPMAQAALRLEAAPTQHGLHSSPHS